ncbi:MAG: CopG family transcriptional regulator [Anaerolineae bacterium]|nr:CopG family transcriptional regulator [Anaerolineae bacterium]
MGDTQDLTAVKARYQIPPQLQACHTAIVDGYIVEGHVPVAEIRRLLAERPDIIGMAVPGMPVGSPGMEVAGTAPQPYEVVAFDKSGKTEVFASYP